ncbi:uncharacterized protein N7484_000017 [Penicillium longicatenatum]|uniref:uncharacterized protein n=1 Tax=Penicillium longicatenatum TaxID=1561947 RepID=UPI00254711D4|nr:uncharacterized protein N7484_000017 [Penicillium longicatenatum]KAJ5660645.1 hypothetical protein N7484_000017 [Penicillium longicatenatum]
MPLGFTPDTRQLVNPPLPQHHLDDCANTRFLPPTGQPPPYRMHHLLPSGPRSPPPPPRPPRPPSQLAPPPLPSAGAPPKGSPCGTTVQPAGCLAWAIPPGRGPRPPSHRQA